MKRLIMTSPFRAREVFPAKAALSYFVVATEIKERKKNHCVDRSPKITVFGIWSNKTQTLFNSIKLLSLGYDLFLFSFAANAPACVGLLIYQRYPKSKYHPHHVIRK